MSNQNRGKDVGRNRYRQMQDKAAVVGKLSYDSNTNTSNNYTVWLEKLKTTILKEYPRHSYLFGNTDFVQIATPRNTNAELDAMNQLEYEDAMRIFNHQWKVDAKYNQAVKEERISIFSTILDTLTQQSLQQVKANAKYKTECFIDGNEPVYNPYSLLKLIQEIHVGFTGSNKVNIDVARNEYRTRLAKASQGNQSLIEFSNYLTELRSEEVKFATDHPLSMPVAGDPNRTAVVLIHEDEKPYTMQFMENLNKSHCEAYANYKNGLNLEGKDVFKTIIEAYNFVSNFVSTRNAQSLNELQTRLTLLTKANKEINLTSRGKSNSRTNSKAKDNHKEGTKKEPDDCKKCIEEGKTDNLKHWFPRDCPSVKRKRKRDSNDTEVDNKVASNAFMKNLNDSNKGKVKKPK